MDARSQGDGDVQKILRGTPEALGFSSQRLQRFDNVMQGLVDGKEFAGIVTMSARHGKVFHSKTYGLKDLASGTPMQKDTIFRIYNEIVSVGLVQRMNSPFKTQFGEVARQTIYQALTDAKKQLRFCNAGLIFRVFAG